MIEIKDLNFGYGKKLLFNGLCLSLKPGIYGLLGKNGAGKSSLLRIMAGMLYPQSGECLAFGEDGGTAEGSGPADGAGVSGQRNPPQGQGPQFQRCFRPGGRAPEFLQEVFLLCEEFFLPALGIADYVKLYSPFYPRFDRELLDRFLGELELPREAYLHKMSYGQKKKFLLAFGLAAKTRVLLLDEPTNGLDIPSKAQFRRLVAGHWSEDRCIVISTHQVKDVEQLIEPVVIVDSGRIIFNHTLEEVAARLKVSLAPEEKRGEGILYCEKTLGGWAHLEKAATGQGGSAMDLELLFNGVLNAQDRVNALFEEGSYA